jgi:hypothetical protein
VALREIAAGKVTQANMAEAIKAGFFKTAPGATDEVSNEIAEEMAKNMADGAGLADDGLETRDGDFEDDEEDEEEYDDEEA